MDGGQFAADRGHLQLDPLALDCRGGRAGQEKVQGRHALALSLNLGWAPGLSLGLLSLGLSLGLSLSLSLLQRQNRSRKRSRTGGIPLLLLLLLLLLLQHEQLAEEAGVRPGRLEPLPLHLEGVQFLQRRRKLRRLGQAPRWRRRRRRRRVSDSDCGSSGAGRGRRRDRGAIRIAGAGPHFRGNHCRRRGRNTTAAATTTAAAGVGLGHADGAAVVVVGRHSPLRILRTRQHPPERGAGPLPAVCDIAGIHSEICGRMDGKLFIY